MGNDAGWETGLIDRFEDYAILRLMPEGSPPDRSVGIQTFSSRLLRSSMRIHRASKIHGA